MGVLDFQFYYLYPQCDKGTYGVFAPLSQIKESDLSTVTFRLRPTNWSC